jgi:hypothetical protein
MNTGLLEHDAAYLTGDVAMELLEPPWNVLAASSRLASSPQHRHVGRIQVPD